MQHVLKCDSELFGMVQSRQKTAEIRINDRGYSLGDTLLLKEWIVDDENPKGGLFTGNAHETAPITHITEGGKYGIEEGYVLLSWYGQRHRICPSCQIKID